jgi:hypothetical protein
MEDVIYAMTEAGDDEPVPAASDTRMNKNVVRATRYLDVNRFRISPTAFSAVLPAD